MIRLSISNRIYAGFTVVLALCATVGMTGYDTADRGAALLSAYADIGARAIDTEIVSQRLAEAQARITLYAQRGRPKDLSEARSLLSDTAATLARIAASETAEETKALIDRTAELTTAYAANLEKLDRSRRDQEGLKESLEGLAAAADRDLEQLSRVTRRAGDPAAGAIIAQAHKDFVSAREAVLMYYATGDQAFVLNAAKSFNRFRKEVEEFTATTSAETAGKALAVSAAATAAEYRTTFLKTTDIVDALVVLSDDVMVKQGRELVQLARDAAEAQTRRMEETRRHSANQAIEAQLFLTGFSIAAVLFGGLLSFLIARGIVRPVRGMTEAMTRLARGETAVAVPGLAGSDEIGGMARAVVVFRDSMLETERLKAETARHEAEAAERQRRVMFELADTFENRVASVAETVGSAAGTLGDTADGLLETALRTGERADTASVAASRAAGSVRSVALATEQLTSAISEISRHVAHSTDIASQAVAEADSANMRIQGLVDQARRIGEIVDLITGVATQTNLLALNATIEAARAGEAGRGFAIVASEVKGLAAQTARATEEISERIASIQDATGGAANAIDDIGQTIGTIKTIAASIAGAVAQQGVATSAIARDVETAVSGADEATGNISAVGDSAGATGEVANHVREAAGDLGRQADILKREVARIVTAMRAA